MTQESGEQRPDAGRQPNPMDEAMSQAQEIGQQRRADFIKQEQRDLEQARTDLEMRERAFDEALTRQETESERAEQTAQTELQQQRQTQADISNQAEEVGRQPKPNTCLLYTSPSPRDS